MKTHLNSVLGVAPFSGRASNCGFIIVVFDNHRLVFNVAFERSIQVQD